MELSAASMDRLLRKNGAKRVSEGAKRALCEVIVDFADNICRKAIKLAEHGGRVTVKADDVKLSAKT